MNTPPASTTAGKSDVSISVITATFNAADHLPRLISSLEAQTDTDFTWIVADGDSSDQTLFLLDDAAARLSIAVDSQKDCGIYDALNRAIGICRSDYYLVAGADDHLEPNAVELYRSAATQSRADLVTARVIVDGVVRPWRRRWEWLYGPWAHVSSHAVGLLIRTALHQEFGRYRTDLRIASDQNFVLECMRGGARLRRSDFVAGEFATTGTTGKNLLANLLESFSIRIGLGDRLIVQLPLLMARLIWHRKRLRAPSTRRHASR